MEMNQKDINIWKPGLAGMIFAFRKFLRNFVESIYFEQLIIICVITNTFALSMDGTMTS